MRHTITAIACSLVLAVAMAERALGQSTTDLETLTKEVRLLRQSLEMFAAAGIRAHIIFGRLQLQEQRTKEAMHRLDALRERLAGTSRQFENIHDSLTQYEQNATTAVDPRQRELNATAIRETKSYLIRVENERARLFAEESEAANKLAMEQGRWSDLNRVLDELERALVRK